MSARRPIEGAVVAVFFVLVTVLTVAGFAMDWLPPAASAHGPMVDAVIRYLLTATGVFFVVGHVVLAWFLWRHRGEGVGPYRPVSPRAEWGWVLGPALAMSLVAEVGVLVLARPVWKSMYGDVPANALRVEVVGKQFEWLVRYPGKDGAFGRVDPALVNDASNPLGLDEKDPAAKDDLIYRGTMPLPSGRPVVVRLRSLDVLHSFSVPLFRVKQDVVPGFTTTAQFTSGPLGRYEIACAELCGLGHYRMRGFVIVKTPEEFEAWLGTQTGWFE